MLELKQLRDYVTRTLFTTALFLSICALASPVVLGQEQSASTQGVEASTAQPKAVDSSEKASDVVKPKWDDYKGITLGMSADEVRAKLAGLKDKGKVQDFFVLSDAENVQVYYDDQGKVQAISVNYVDAKKAPDTVSVLGEEVKANADGSMYKLVRYPEAGYWVAYSRTAGDSPLITVTIQKM